MSLAAAAAATARLAAAEAESEALRDQVEDQADLIENLRAEIAEFEASSNKAAAGDGAPTLHGGGGSGGDQRPWGNNNGVRSSWSGVLGDRTGGGIDRGSTTGTADFDVRDAAVAAAQSEADGLRRKLAESERELQRMVRRAATASANSTALLLPAGRKGEEGLARLEEDNRRLKEDNEKLSGELQAFDLDFFEEIEDLKYKYSEAARKLRQYEERSR